MNNTPAKRIPLLVLVSTLQLKIALKNCFEALEDNMDKSMNVSTHLVRVAIENVCSLSAALDCGSVTR